MRHAMKTPPTTLLGSVLIVCMGLVTSIYGQSTPGPVCGLSIQNNSSVLNQLSKVFDKESNIVIVEYTVTFRNASDGNDFSKKTRKDSFQPWKWYRTQGPESSRLLLTYEMLFGIVRSIFWVGIESVDLVVNVNAPGCFKSLANGTSETVIRDFLLTDLEKSVSQEEISSKDVNICTGKFSQLNNQWYFEFSCCSVDHDNGGFINCYEVKRNGWGPLLLFTIVWITLIFPSFLPLDSTRKRVDGYYYTIPENQSVALNIARTRKADVSRYPQCQQIQETLLETLCQCKMQLNDNSCYKMRVKWMCLDVPMSRLFSEDRSTFSLRRIVSDFMKEIFSDSETGQSDGQGPEHTENSRRCSERCCNFGSFVTFYAMVLIALPSLPVAIAVFNKNLWYWQMVKEWEEISVDKVFLNITLFRFYIGFVYFIYVLVTVMVPISDKNFIINEIHKYMTYQREIKDTTEEVMKTIKKCFYWKVKDCINRCIFCSPIILIISALMYVFITIFAFFVTSPFIIIYAVFARQMNSIREKNCFNEHENNNKCCQYIKLFFIFLAFYFILQVVFFGAMFLIVLFISIILLIVIEVNFLNKIIPVIIVLLFYVRDSYKKVGSRFDNFMGHLLEDQMFTISDIFRNNLNNMFKVTCDEPSSIKIKQSKLWLESKHPFLFVSEDKIKHISRYFFYTCSTMKCEGAPGALRENYINETKRLIKIGLFLVFVFMIVMAYGSYVFISTDKYLIITFISGLVPKILEIISTRHSDVKLDERFHEFLQREINQCNEEWAVNEMHVEFYPAPREEIDLIVVRN